MASVPSRKPLRKHCEMLSLIGFVDQLFIHLTQFGSMIELSPQE